MLVRVERVLTLNDLLPVEVIWLIFSWVFDTADSWNDFVRRRIKCRGVCAHWRVVIRDYPRFWSTIVVARHTTQEFFQVCVERSKAVPIQLTVDASDHGCLLEDGGSVSHLLLAQPLHFFNKMLRDVLPTCASRVTSVRIESDGYYNLHSIASTLAALTLPAVASLSVGVDWVFSASPLCVFPAPSWGPVDSLACRGVLPVVGGIDAYSALRVARITSIRGLDTISFAGFLHSLHHLHELHIANVECDETDCSLLVELVSVEILHLRYDDDSSARLFRCLRFPRLLTFTAVVSDSRMWENVSLSCAHLLPTVRHFGLACTTDNLEPPVGLWSVLTSVHTVNVAIAGPDVSRSLWRWICDNPTCWPSLCLLELGATVRQCDVEDELNRRTFARRVSAPGSHRGVVARSRTHSSCSVRVGNVGESA
ncbi:hypothetical protein R3P38DRAFT_2770269 [Favolaschia claudopus]|uniref:F-box domain-containing protein n=1 Tax=Favolaschia claudopus TaxID=2862362 RepID=A0AAW0CFP0_9AGAR